MSLIKNPLFKIDETITDPETEEEVKKTKFNIINNYQEIYIICLLKNMPLSEKYFGQFIDKKDLDEFEKNLVLYKCDKKIINNDLFCLKAFSSSSTTYKKYNLFGYNLPFYVLYVPILNINFLNIQKYISSIYNQENNIKSLYDVLILNNYFNLNIHNININASVEKLILNLNEINFWKNDLAQVFLNHTYFERRVFNKSNVKKVKFDDENYMDEIFESTQIKQVGEKYSNLNKISFSKDTLNSRQIENIIFKLDLNLQYLLFLTLLLSKDYVTHVLNNQKLLCTFKHYISGSMFLMNYILKFAWRILTIKEIQNLTNKNEIDVNFDYIFTINTASQLPVFPFSHANPNFNPYFVLLSKINSTSNLYGFGTLKDKTFLKKEGIATYDEFKERLNIFTSFKANNNIFEGINFKENKMSIVGSCVCACLQKHHPLLNLFSKEGLDVNSSVGKEKLYTRFFNEYYSESDIDILINTNNIPEFTVICNNIFSKVKENICKLFDAEEAHVKSEIVSNVYLILNKNFISDYLVSDGLTFKEIKDNLNSNTVKKLLTPIINSMIDKELENKSINKTSDLYKKYYKNHNIIIKYYGNRIEIKDSYLIDTEKEISYKISNEKIKNFETYKNKPYLRFNFRGVLSAPQINHKLEIFTNKYKNPMTMVNNFHLPCVRALYDGDNVYLTPSCISAHLTFMNTDFRYFTGAKPPEEILLKYRMRGFGTWLNKNELRLVSKYSNSDAFWQNISDTSKECLSYSSKIFRPRLYNTEYFMEKNLPYVDVTTSYDDYYNTRQIIKTTSELFNFFDNEKTYFSQLYTSNKFNYDFFLKTYKVIKKNIFSKTTNSVSSESDIEENSDDLNWQC